MRVTTPETRRAPEAVHFPNGAPVTANHGYVAEIVKRYELQPSEEWVADVVAQEIERTSRADAFGCFDLDGNGPFCSYCGVLWPLFCNHWKYAEKAHAGRLIEEAERAKAGA